MKKAIVVDTHQAAVIDVPDPTPRDNWVVVKVHAAPMCTEYKRFVSGGRHEYLGHEAAGEVVAVAQPGRVQVGDRVVAMPSYGCGICALCVAGDYIHCEHSERYTPYLEGEGRATYAQYLLKPDWLLPRIPDGVSYDLASLACCGLGPSFGAMQLMQVSAFDTILITGAGPVGLGALINARYRGARAIVVESLPYRVQLAQQLGAFAVLDPNDPHILAHIKDLTAGLGVDCALDCSGNVKAERLCIDATRRKGKVSFIGECRENLAIQASADMIRKGLTVIGAWHYNLREFPGVMQVIQRSPLVNQLISHRFPIDQAQEAFACANSQQAAKIILQPWA